MHPQIFIGSSSEALEYAKILNDVLVGQKVQCITWEKHFEIQESGRTNIHVLKQAVESIRIGIFFLTPDDKTFTRGKVGPSGRTNIWFEIGMFVAEYAERNVFILAESQDLDAMLKPSDYEGINFVRYKLAHDAKEAMRQHFKEQKSDPSKKLDASVRRKVMWALRKAYQHSIKHHIKDLEVRPTLVVKPVPDREACYQVAESLIKEARVRLYTVISYENEFIDKKRSLWPCLKARLKQAKKSKETLPKIRRWMNLGSVEIVKQAREILTKFPNEVVVRDTYCHFIEVVLTENKTLILLPKPDLTPACVGRGILIESEEVANEFATWFEQRVPEKLNIDLKSSNLDAYLKALIRNEGPRNANGTRCFSCSAEFHQLPQNKRDIVDELCGRKKVR